MAEKHVTVQSHPLPEVFVAVSVEPFLFGVPHTGLAPHQYVWNRNENMLLLRQG